MHEQRIGWLVRLVGDRATRRGVLASLASLHGLGAGEGLARRRHRQPHGKDAQVASCRGMNQSCTKKRPGIGKRRKCCAGLVCRNKQCRVQECSSFLGCSENRTCCDGVCVELQTDPKHCGQCGKECGGSPCLNGSCVSACRDGLTSCNGSCVDSLRDPEHCGGCGITCGGNTPLCVSGQCRCPITCTGVCVDPQTDPKHCGGCGNVCPDGAICQDGLLCIVTTCAPVGSACVASGDCCDFPAFGCIDGVCRNRTSFCKNDGETCQANVDCCNSPASVCRNGICGSRCRPGFTYCGNCVDLTTDPANCGGCGQSCGAGGTCVNGQCQGCVPFGGACAAASDCCLLNDGSHIPCTGGLCRFN